MSPLSILILVSPVFLIMILCGIAFYRKKACYRPALLASAFSSAAVIFFLIRVRGPFPGGADIGFGIILLFSPLFTWPLAALGWFLGRKTSNTQSILLGLLAVFIYVGLSLSYVKLMKKEANRLNELTH